MELGARNIQMQWGDGGQADGGTLPGHGAQIPGGLAQYGVKYGDACYSINCCSIKIQGFFLAIKLLSNI